jgi:hypothetical protein
MLYEAGVQFHRQHGRLPGAVPTASPDRRKTVREPLLEPAPARRSRRWRVLWVCAAALVVVGLMFELPGEDEPIAQPAFPVTQRQVPSASMQRNAINDGLRVGMPERNVLGSIGAPISVEGGRWLYGPSWIRLEEGRVVEWYSSPLHPLKVSRISEPWVDD